MSRLNKNKNKNDPLSEALTAKKNLTVHCYSCSLLDLPEYHTSIGGATFLRRPDCLTCFKFLETQLRRWELQKRKHKCGVKQVSEFPTSSLFQGLKWQQMWVKEWWKLHFFLSVEHKLKSWCHSSICDSPVWKQDPVETLLGCLMDLLHVHSLNSPD